MLNFMVNWSLIHLGDLAVLTTEVKKVNGTS